MAVLGTLVFPNGVGYAQPRSQLIAWAMDWQNPTTLLTPGNPSLYLEHTYGGYRVYLKFFDWVYAWSGKTLHPDNIIEDLWAYPPGSGTPVSVGITEVYFYWDTTVRGWALVVSPQGSVGAGIMQKFPEAPPGYYNPPYPASITYPYSIP